MRAPLPFLALASLILLSASIVRAADDPSRLSAANVLVLYQADDADRDADGTPDSRQLAEYYAARRAVPAENLLGLKLNKDGKPVAKWDYKTFFDLILKPVSDKLAAKSADGKPVSDHICCIATTPGLPVSFVFGAPDKDSKDLFRTTQSRSVDQFLVSIDANVKAGVDEERDSPGKTASGNPLGGSRREVGLPTYAIFARQDKSFRQLRAEQPAVFNFYLVSRLGLDLATGRDGIDGALYAERYLRLPGPDEKTNSRPAIWLDQKLGFAADQVASMHATVMMLRGQGGAGNPFAKGQGLNSPWPLVIDNQPEEIGIQTRGLPSFVQQLAQKPAATEPGWDLPSPLDRAQHYPTFSAKIASVDADGVTLEGKAKPEEAPPALYAPTGWKVTVVKVDSAAKKVTLGATAAVTGADAAANRLRLDSTKGFAAGDTIFAAWPAKFPASDCFIFFGFYGLGQYEDVFQFPPGSIGVHVDSSCMNWASGAMRRGMAATFGVTSEPFSAGIPHGHLMIHALAQGRSWAEAAAGSVVFGQRWAGVTFGDPLYAPFRSLQKVDKTPPALGPITAKITGKELVVRVDLVTSNDDEAADVALFRLDYGPTDKYGKCVDFFDWPDPDKSKGVPARRFGYSRHCAARIPAPAEGETLHFRITARDPAGLESTSTDRTFTP